MAALEQAYTSYIASERFPCCVLFLDIEPSLVDVNVHPAKLEVKFSNEKPVFETVYYAVRGALEGNVSRPDVALPTTKRQVTDAYVPIEDGSSHQRYSFYCDKAQCKHRHILLCFVQQD